MRVAFTFEQCWHRVPGGTATSALGQARALLALDDVELVGVSARHAAPPDESFLPPVPVRQVPLPRVAMYESWQRLRLPRIEGTTGTVDVVHATGVAVPPCRAPLVVTVHDLAFLRFPGHATRHGQRFFERALDRTRRHATLVLCPSQATADDCERAGIDAARLRVVPWGVDSTRATSEEVDAVRGHYDLPERFVLFVGTIEPRKNLRRLLAAWADLRGTPHLPLVLVGPSGWNENLHTELAALGNRVRSLGFVPPGPLRALYAAAAVVCYPSIFEGFGLPVLEAMAQATPVVTSARTACSEVVADAGVLVDPRSPDDIRLGIERLLDDPAGAAELGRRGRERALGFTWERVGRQTRDAYREVSG